MSLPSAIKALMRNSVTWEHFTGTDGHGDPKYASPQTLKCWLEDRGSQGGIQRVQRPGLTTINPEADVYMDANDIDAGTVTMGDRFTTTINGQSFQTKPDGIRIVYGPDSSAWLVVVSL